MAGYGAGLVVGLGMGLVALGAVSVMRPELGRTAPEVAKAAEEERGGASLTGAAEAEPAGAEPAGADGPAADVSSSRQPAGD